MSGVRWVVSARGFGFHLPMEQYQALKRAASTLRHEVVRWPDADALFFILCDVGAGAKDTLRFTVPARLYAALKAALTRAKDECSPRYASEFAWLLEQVEERNEVRSAIDRLGDLGA